jgi:putative FmdB family regulatory protein
MPTYEYVCEKCGHTFEQFQPIAAKPLKTCPQDVCAQKRWGKGRVKRLISTGVGLLFKGSGFYITDYRSENYKQGAKKESSTTTPAAPASGADGKPTPAKTEAPAAKPKNPKA